MQSTRNYGFDILRVLACYLVIQVHAGEFYYIGQGGLTLPGEDPFWVGILNSLCRTAVPLFVMLSGYFLLPVKEEVGPFLKKRFTRVLIPFVVWCVLYAIYWAVKGQTDWMQAGVNVLHIPVNFGVEVGHLWYVYMLIGLYLFAPMISPWIASVSKKGMELYLIIWAVSLCVPYIHLIYPAILGECFWNQTPLLYYFSGFLGYMILAAYIKKFMPEKKAWHVPVGLLMIVIGYVFTAGGFIASLGAEYVKDLELTWGFETINVALMSMGLFLVLRHLSIQHPDRVGMKVVGDVSKLSYGMYLVHIMILNQFYALFNPLFDSAWIKIPVIAVSTFLVSYLIVKVLSYLPKSKYLVG